MLSPNLLVYVQPEQKETLTTNPLPILGQSPAKKRTSNNTKAVLEKGSCIYMVKKKGVGRGGERRGK